MATTQDFIDYVAEQIDLGVRLSYRKMFGEYAVYVDGKVVALVCDNSLFLKPSPAATELAPNLPLQPPYPGARNHPVADELLDDGEALRAVILATAAVLPAPKPKQKRKRVPKRR